METLHNTNEVVTKNDIRWRGTCTQGPPLPTPLNYDVVDSSGLVPILHTHIRG